MSSEENIEGDGHVFSPKRELARTPPKPEIDFMGSSKFEIYRNLNKTLFFIRSISKWKQ